jgi:hypothetical protein
VTLSTRATTYLSTLRRLAAVPTRTVDEVLRARLGKAAPTPWLDFHERFAGYVEPLGNESAVWGLTHHQSRWYQPLTVSIEQSLQAEAASFIGCAEVHPSYVYQLGDTGFFRDPAAQTFELKIERNAARLEFFANAKKPSRVLEPSAPVFTERAKATPLIAEASDAFFRVYASRHLLAVQRVTDGRFVEGWQAP